MGCCSSKLNFYSGEIFALLNKCDENSECIGLAQLIKVGKKKVWIFRDQENKAKFKRFNPMYNNNPNYAKIKYLF